MSIFFITCYGNVTCYTNINELHEILKKERRKEFLCAGKEQIVVVTSRPNRYHCAVKKKIPHSLSLSLFVRRHLICDIQMRGGTIEVIVTPLTNGTRASRRAAPARPTRDIVGGCQTPAGKAGHALLPFRGVKWKSKRYNGVATSPRSTVSSSPLARVFLSASLCPSASRGVRKICRVSSRSLTFSVALVRISRTDTPEK